MKIARCPVCNEPGTIHLRWQRCGKPNCKCASGQLHGPYAEVNHIWCSSYDRNGRKVYETSRCYVSKKVLAAKENARIRYLIATLGRHRSIEGYVPRRPKKKRSRSIDEILAKPRPVVRTVIVEPPKGSGSDQIRERLREEIPQATKPQPMPAVKQQPRPVAVPQPEPVVEKPRYVCALKDTSLCDHSRCTMKTDLICPFDSPVTKKPIEVAPSMSAMSKKPCPTIGDKFCNPYCRLKLFYICRHQK
jgi:hypothetical protein